MNVFDPFFPVTLAEAHQREVDRAEAALEQAVERAGPDRPARRRAIEAAEKAGVVRKEALEAAKKKDEALAAAVAAEEEAVAAYERKVTAWINAKSNDKDRRWGFEEED